MGIFKKTRIVYMGTPEFAVAPLEALISKGYDIAGVVTVADKPSGRGLKMNESAVKKYAVEHGIPVLQPVKLKDPEFLEALKAWKADLFVVVAFRMLPEEVWSMPKLGTFNLHAALLPQYRGAAPINWAVINGEQMTGVTTFMIDKDIDTGGIILREDCRINDTDTAGDIHDKLMSMGAGLVVETVQGILEGNAELRVQRSFIQGSEVLKPAPKLTKELCHIDWNDSTKNIYNLIRGLSPYPAAFTELVSSESSAPVQLKIFSASKMQLDSPATPGTVLSDGKTYLAITTADGAISIDDLQLAGKKRMDVKSFLLGFRNPESYSCTPGTSKAVIEKTLAR
ncbi:MAG: methionyl-tRNA formyltransferase [Bacteroidia bacterium]|nr:methionyl-tRNA formyltransferase [Bacteroidia bacterium]